MLPLLIVGLALIVVALAAGWGIDKRNEKARMGHIERALAAKGHTGQIEVRPRRAEDCWRAREGFYWRSDQGQGYACAGPGAQVDFNPPRREPRKD